jgi:hypothetical protein
LYTPDWIQNGRDAEYIEKNVAAHEQLVRGEARLMNLGAVWIRKELHSTTVVKFFHKDGSWEKLVIPAPPHITVWMGKTPSRIHWHGHLNCIEIIDKEDPGTDKRETACFGRGVHIMPDGRDTVVDMKSTHVGSGIPYRIEVAWNKAPPPYEIYSYGLPLVTEAPKPLEPGQIYVEPYCPPMWRGTDKEVYFSLPVPRFPRNTEEYIPPSREQCDEYHRTYRVPDQSDVL